MRIRPSLVVLWACLASGCGVGLRHNLDELQANEVVAALDRAGIAADKAPDDGTQGRWRVTVARGELGRAIAVLAAEGLPREGGDGVARTFASQGLVPSALAERARLAASLGTDLERTLAALPGVAGARVHVALPVDDPLRADESHARPTASVLLRVLPAATVREAEVKRLVAGAVEGLDPADVAVTIAAAPVEVSAPALARLGPLRVAADSRPVAVALLSAAFVTVLGLALLVIWGAFRMSALRRRIRELERS